MSLKIGIVGLPNVGKSSLFNALTNNNVLVANYPFATIEPNLGSVKHLDKRVTKLSELVKPEKTTYATVDFLDIAGLVKGASKGEGLGNKFLENIRSVNVICLVARCFEDKEILSVNSKIDPVFDAQIIALELIYADLETIGKSISKMKSNNPMLGLLGKLKKHLEDNKMLNTLPLSDEEENELKQYQFLTKKTFIFLGNISEDPSSMGHYESLRAYGVENGAECLALNIRQELELSKLPVEEHAEYLSMLGLTESSLNKLIAVAFDALKLKTYFTVGNTEVRAWQYRDGSTIQECAGLIHTDLRDGFIKAKIVKYQDFLDLPDYKALFDGGKVGIMGKNYLTQDGDLVTIEFKS